MQVSYSIVDNVLSLKAAAYRLSGSIFPISILLLLFAAVR